MNPAVVELYRQACEIRQLAYAPYSGFQVGAVVETIDGQIFAGCNVENGSYGLCICAERVAIANAVSAGHQNFRRIVVVATPIASPCGACRQVISEFFTDDGSIYAFDAEDVDNSMQWTLKELLPQRFEFRLDR